MKKQSGFTLLEMLIALVLLGVASTIAALSFDQNIASWRFAWGERQYENNRRAANAHMNYAYEAGNGRLLAPVTYSGYKYSPVHLTSTATTYVALRDHMMDEGLDPNMSAHDGSPAMRLKVYQRISMTKDVPIEGFVGETVRLGYDTGVIYQTECTYADSSCNTGVPGDSPTLTTSNYTTWTTTGTDTRPVFFSSYQIQRQFWAQSMGRINTVIAKISEAYSAAQMAAGGGDSSNFYPVPTGAGAADLSGASAATNQYCYDGWYNLGAANVNVLTQVGLNKTQYSTTLWNGTIEYCADYDPALGGEDTGVHTAALRIMYYVTTGSVPSTNISLNRFFTF